MISLICGESLHKFKEAESKVVPRVQHSTGLLPENVSVVRPFYPAGICFVNLAGSKAALNKSIKIIKK